VLGDPESVRVCVFHSQCLNSFHSQCLEFDTQDTGPAFIRMRLTLARGPLDPLLSQPYRVLDQPPFHSSQEQ
jgi:hypothetical protein